MLYEGDAEIETSRLIMTKSAEKGKILVTLKDNRLVLREAVSECIRYLAVNNLDTMMELAEVTNVISDISSGKRAALVYVCD